jgi:hypothetical protein
MDPSRSKTDGVSYRIVVRGALSDRFLRAFPDAVAQAEGGATSLLTASFDQSQLSGFLQRLSSFGLELISVTQHAGSDEAEVGPMADESPRVDRRPGDDGSPRPDPS